MTWFVFLAQHQHCLHKFFPQLSKLRSGLIMGQGELIFSDLEKSTSDPYTNSCDCTRCTCGLLESLCCFSLWPNFLGNIPDLAVCCDQALSQKEAEKAALTEKLAALQQDLATAGMETERMQREALSKQEQDKVKCSRVILALVTFLVLYI